MNRGKYPQPDSYSGKNMPQENDPNDSASFPYSLERDNQEIDSDALPEENQTLHSDSGVTTNWDKYISETREIDSPPEPQRVFQENETDINAVSDRGLDTTSYSGSRYFFARSILMVFMAAVLILGGVLIGIYGWVESDQLVIEQTVVPAPEVVTSAPGQDTEPEVQDTAAAQIETPESPAPSRIAETDEPVTAVAAAVSPSVVRIDTTTGTGSGIILDTNGLVVTNAHVVNGVQTVDIRLADGTRAAGTVLGSDPNVDVAIVRIEGDAILEKAQFASSDTVQVGQLAVAIGSPFGLEQSVTAGIVSAINRAVQHANVVDGSLTVVEMIQTDAPINPGNSGGALADRQGRVIGMNTSIRTDGIVAGNLGVGFAIPSDTLLLVADRIVNGESLDVGFLGISGQNPALGRAGALIVDVIEGSPAWEGGLNPGDLVISVDGSPILGMSELAAKIRLTSPGTPVEIEVIRNGEQAVFIVVLGTLGSN